MEIKNDFISFNHPTAEPVTLALDTRVFMFFSVDLVNSTTFKSMHPDKWTPVVMEFYKTIEGCVYKAFENNHSYGNAKIWKHVGDEVLFYFEISDLHQILEAPTELHTAMIRAQKAFYKICDDMGAGSIIENFLFFKGALWLAVADKYDTTKSDSARNVYTNQLSGEQDFIGIDIDEGFRMAENTLQGMIVIDPKIAYFINEHEGELHRLTSSVKNEKIKIIDYIKLKGVWGGRYFPVIWYTENWKDDAPFIYDAEYTNDLVKTYVYSIEKDRSIEKITKVFEDLGFPLRAVAEIKEILDKKSEQESEDELT